MHGWSRRIVTALGIELKYEGALPLGGAVVCNHLSYLDVLVMSAIASFVMVAKSEVRRWPLLGRLTAQAGTVYVERGGGPATYPAVNEAMAEAYRSGLPVLFFPEGTTTDGAYAEDGVMPFRRGLFHSVLAQGVPLQVAALRYSLGDGNGTATVGQDVCWWGEMLLGPHLFQFLGLRGVKVEVQFGGAVVARADRFILSECAREAVVAMYAELNAKRDSSGVVGYEAELVEAL